MLINTFYQPLAFGGAEQSVQLLAESLVKCGHQTCVITTGPSALPRRQEINGVQIRRVSQPNIYAWDGRPRPGIQKVLWHAIDTFVDACEIDFPSLIPDWTPDIINTNCTAGFGASSLASLSRLAAPVVQTLRDYYFLCGNAAMYRHDNCVERCLSCTILGGRRSHFLKKVVDGFIGISRLVFETHAAQLPWMRDLPSCILPNGLTFQEGDLSPDPGLHKTRSKRLTFGYLGRLSGEKGVLDLMKAALQSESFSEFDLRIAGEGPLSSELRSEACSAEHIFFEGKVDPRAFLNTIDILIVPSLWREPFSRVVIEAWRSGIPVVCSQSVGASSYISEGVDGLVYAGALEFSPSFLRKCVSLTSRDGLSNDCRKKVQQFDAQTVAKDSVTFFESILQRAV